jgi:anti-sigma regulatory factor (Ser/Thr protein kinase)
MTSSRCIAVIEESQVGFARRDVAEICERVSNEVLHGHGGEIVIREVLTPTSSTLQLVALDRGPGMRNIAECFRDGFSTAGTAGTGFGSIKRLSDQFEMFS